MNTADVVGMCRRMVAAAVVLAVAGTASALDLNRQRLWGNQATAFPTPPGGVPLCTTTANNATFTLPTRSIDFDAGEWTPDGTYCTQPSTRTVNSGPAKWAVNCADNNSSVVQWSVMTPDGWNGGTVTAELRAESENATPSGNWVVNIRCQCVRSGDVISSSWGTAQSATITFATQYKEQHATTAAITCSGTCAGGASVYWQATTDAAGTTATMADVYALGVKIEYSVGCTDQ